MRSVARLHAGQLVVHHGAGCGCGCRVVDVSETNIVDNADVFGGGLLTLVRRADPEEVAQVVRQNVALVTDVLANGNDSAVRALFNNKAVDAWRAVMADRKLVSLSPQLLAEVSGAPQLRRRVLAQRIASALAATPFIPGATKKDTGLGAHIIAQQFAHRFNADVLQREHVKNASKLVRELTDQYQREFNRLIGDIKAKLAGVTDPDKRRELMAQMRSARGVIGARLQGLRQFTDEWGDRVKTELDGNALRSLRDSVDRAFDRLWDVDMDGNTIAGEAINISLARQGLAKATMVREFFRVNADQLEVALGNTPLLAGRVADDAKRRINDVIVRSSFLRGANAKFAEREIRRRFSKQLEGIKLGVAARAKFIARTETARIQADGDLRTQAKLGVRRVEVFYSAGAFPCQICPDIANGGPYPIDKVPEGGIPFHPNCRCSYGPVVDDPLVSPLWNEGENRAADAMVTVRVDGQEYALAIQRTDGSLALPGGFVDGNKAGSAAARATAIRELEEETGLKLSKAVKRDAGEIGYFRGPGRDPRDGFDRHVSSRGYLFDLGDRQRLPKVAGLDDAVGAKWVPLSDLQQSTMFADHSRILSAGLELKGVKPIPPRPTIAPPAPAAAPPKPPRKPRAKKTGGVPTVGQLDAELKTAQLRQRQLGQDYADLGQSEGRFGSKVTGKRMADRSDSILRISQERIANAEFGTQAQALLDEMEDGAENLYRLRLRQLALSTEAERNKIIDEIADRIVERGKIEAAIKREQSKRFGQATARVSKAKEIKKLKEVVAESLRVMPDDIVARAEVMLDVGTTAQRGYHGGGFVNSGWEGFGAVKNRIPNLATMDHEIGHFVDDIFGDARGIPSYVTSNGQIWKKKVTAGWRGNEAGDRMQRAKGTMQRVFDRQIKAQGRQKGTYKKKGEGRYWLDNWLNNYEGRIYTGRAGRGDKGIEFWTMNSQRYLADKRRREAVARALRSEGIPEEVIVKIATDPDLGTANLQLIATRANVERELVDAGVSRVQAKEAARALRDVDRKLGFKQFNEARDWTIAKARYGDKLGDAMEEVWGKPRVKPREPKDVSFIRRKDKKTKRVSFKPRQPVFETPPTPPDPPDPTKVLPDGRDVSVRVTDPDRVGKAWKALMGTDFDERAAARLLGMPEGTELEITARGQQLVFSARGRTIKLREVEVPVNVGTIREKRVTILRAEGTRAGDKLRLPDGEGGFRSYTVQPDDLGRLVDKEAFNATRILDRDEAGRVFIKNQSTRQFEQGTGLGTRMTVAQARAAREAGVKYIKADLARFDSDNPLEEFIGYVVWPRLGYNKRLTALQRVRAPGSPLEKIRRIFDKERGPQTVLDLFKTKEGRAWWARNGATIEDAILSLDPDAAGWRALEAYLDRKGFVDP